MQVLDDGKIIEAAEQDDYNSDEVIRCYGCREIELLAEKCGFTVKDHLSRKQLEQPDYVPGLGEPRGMLVLAKTA